MKVEGIVIINRVKGVYDFFCYGKMIGNYFDLEFCEYFF